MHWQDLDPSFVIFLEPPTVVEKLVAFDKAGMLFDKLINSQSMHILCLTQKKKKKKKFVIKLLLVYNSKYLLSKWIANSIKY